MNTGLANFENNVILTGDSYKYSMPVQYPPGTESVFSYIEARAGIWHDAVYNGLQAFIRKYLSRPITKDDIDFAEMIIKAHGEPFYREQWEYILEKHNGYLPLIIKGADEGTPIPIKQVLVTIENTDPKCFWLTTLLETALLRAIWYPTTVATNSFECKKIIQRFLKKTGDENGLLFKLHDFGARGVSSLESAAIGGTAHLINFMGTDNISGILHAMKYYDAEVCGFSIPAMEHSTVTSWGRDKEVEAYRNMLKQFAKPGALLAAVSDSYNIYEACGKLWGEELRQEVIDSGAIVVVRPDSGKPAEVVLKCIQILDSKFGSTVNEKGYKVLNYVRVIQGDGINSFTIEQILETLEKAGYSADNVAFGMGGALLQQVNRDTMGFAMKCSAIKINGEWFDVQKDPITDSGKKSKAGRLVLIRNLRGEYHTVRENSFNDSILKTRYENGDILNMITFNEVRKNASI